MENLEKIPLIMKIPMLMNKTLMLSKIPLTFRIILLTLFRTFLYKNLDKIEKEGHIRDHRSKLHLDICELAEKKRCCNFEQGAP